MNKSFRGVAGVALGLMLGQAAWAQNWQLVWQDEFNGSIGPDWVFETGGGGWGNNELEYYRKENATIENGNLVITAKREDYGGYRYTSARMKTQGKKSFKFGRIEARIKAPSSLGMWPAFWALGSNINTVGWPASGEIDIMEHVNAESDVYGTVHWQDLSGGHAQYGGHTGANVTGYHVYAVEWDAKTIKWFVDGTQYHVIDITNGVNGTEEFQKDFFLLLNLAVGGNWPGFNIDEGAMPARMYVDYVRVYQAGAGGFSQQVEAENFANMAGVQTEACSEGGQNVGWIDANDWMVWNVNVPSAGTYTLQYRVASPGGGGVIQLEKAGGAPVYGSVAVPATGGWQNWTTVQHQVQLPAGQQQIAVKALAGGFNLNWLKIVQ
ncbi:family 16 glycosylhydrolase [Ideonella azotifigens]|nr:carbohydrate-binding protein [Ideonella azotifigens]MCD2340261.1 family 16 glycosylhydrolase [Ideonella azotifigens]